MGYCFLLPLALLGLRTNLLFNSYLLLKIFYTISYSIFITRIIFCIRYNALASVFSIIRKQRIRS